MTRVAVTHVVVVVHIIRARLVPPVVAACIRWLHARVVPARGRRHCGKVLLVGRAIAQMRKTRRDGIEFGVEVDVALVPAIRSRLFRDHGVQPLTKAETRAPSRLDRGGARVERHALDPPRHGFVHEKTQKFIVNAEGTLKRVIETPGTRQHQSSQLSRVVVNFALTVDDFGTGCSFYSHNQWLL